MFESAVATRRGDDGTTGLLFGGDRIRKDDLRAEAYGTIDEAVAALGIARAQLGVKDRLGTLNVGFGHRGSRKAGSVTTSGRRRADPSARPAG